MDNYFDSVPDKALALRRSRELVKLLRLGGFRLTKFVSNLPVLLGDLEDKSNDSKPKTILATHHDPAGSSHVLGLKWEHTCGTLVVSRGTSGDATSSVTQRLLLG